MDFSPLSQRKKNKYWTVGCRAYFCFLFLFRSLRRALQELNNINTTEQGSSGRTLTLCMSWEKRTTVIKGQVKKEATAAFRKRKYLVRQSVPFHHGYPFLGYPFPAFPLWDGLHFDLSYRKSISSFFFFFQDLSGKAQVQDIVQFRLVL